MNTVLASIPRIKPRKSNISVLWDEKQKDLIEVLEGCITQYKMVEVIGCLSSGTELHIENTPDFLEDYKKDQEFTIQVLDAVMKFAENLTEDADTSMECRNIRRRARDQLLIAIGDIEVV